jgi:hypothetical protein
MADSPDSLFLLLCAMADSFFLPLCAMADSFFLPLCAMADSPSLQPYADDVVLTF